MEFLKHRLPNGLEIVAECNAQAYSTALGFFVKTGARDETDEVSGVSHFLEHMAFKGTPTRSADDVNREFDEIGAHYNAGTSEESTIYYAAVLPEYQDQSVHLLGDLMRPSLRSDDFETEKQVILEEIRMYEDQPPFGADDKCRAAHYGSHPLGRSVLGTEQSVADLPVEAMRSYHASRYSPGNISLIGAGRIDFDSLVKVAEQTCGDWKPAKLHRDATRHQRQEAFQVIHKPAASQQYTVFLADGPTAEDDDRYPAKLLAMVIGDDTGSRLYWELVDPGLAEQVSLSHHEFEGAGLFMTYLSCHPDSAADNHDRIVKIYREAETGSISVDELEQAKSKIGSRVVLSGERPRGRLFAVGSDWIQRREYRSIRDDLEEVAAITTEDVAAVMARHPISRATIVTIGPLEDLADPRPKS